jgi:Uma2 family endonuclease
MPVSARKKATYEDLCRLPDSVIGEIVDGELIATPRPSKRHVYAASALSNEIGPPYQFGRGGGPGGWWILFEPEVRLGEHIVVPDLAGWKRERMPSLGEGNQFDLAPDWACEILSPSTVRLDKKQKLPVYAEFGTRYLWLLDPLARTMETFRLTSGKWLLTGFHSGDDKVRAEPFQEVEIELAILWAP